MDLPIDRIAFWLFSTMAVVSALVVVANRNPVVSAIALVSTFLAVAGLYLTMGATFLSAVQVLVYAGAIMVLFLFVIMLLNLERHSVNPPRLGRVMGTGMAAVAMFAFIALVLRGTSVPPSTSLRSGSGAAIGQMFFSDYLFPFEMASLLLLIAMIGAVVVANKKPVPSARQAGQAAPGKQPGEQAGEQEDKSP